MSATNNAMYAMLTDQGTAMPETALCKAHHVEPFIERARWWGEAARDVGVDLTFHDCTGNPELTCTECGVNAANSEPTTCGGAQ
jgi:hypothetical protein